MHRNCINAIIGIKEWTCWKLDFNVVGIYYVTVYE